MEEVTAWLIQFLEDLIGIPIYFKTYISLFLMENEPHWDP